jgi:hypothetical protein
MRSHTPLSADQNCGVSAPRSDNDDCITPRRTIMVRSTTCHAGTPCRHLRIRGSLPRIYAKGIGEAPHHRQQMEVVLHCHPEQTSPDPCNGGSTRTASEKLWICIIPIASRCSLNHQRQIEVVNRRIYARESAKTTLANISTTAILGFTPLRICAKEQHDLCHAHKSPSLPSYAMETREKRERDRIFAGGALRRSQSDWSEKVRGEDDDNK